MEDLNMDTTEDTGLPGAEDESAPEAPDSEDEAQGGEGESDDQQGESTEEGGDGGASTTSGRGEPFKRLLAKYGGDYNKMAEAFYEQANSNARLFEEIRGIKDFIKGQAAPKIDEKKIVEEDPDVQELVRDKQSAEQTVMQLRGQANRALTEYAAVKGKVERLSGKLEAIDPEDTAKYNRTRDELAQAAADQKALHQEYESHLREIRGYEKELKTVERQIKDASARARQKADQLKDQQAQQQADAVAVRQEFAGAMKVEAERYGIDTDSKQFAVLFQTINDRIYSYLDRLPEGAPGVDITKAVQTLMGEYAELGGLKAKFQRDSTTKRQAASPPPDTPGTRSADPARGLPKDPSKWTAAQWDARAKRLLGG